ncbi:formylglycine-generating enzyme family protein [Flavobacterium sp. DG2-3]|uniref:formylglycine-generating enzyme family protein n=1 Tax=Flavobacterium sp. DG2-3 TaxID=3068317 RepID=UPI00273F6475|nr:formylglycine-generating enzyme family protein [Flavobacterium sp. DG2-3]MDP5199953.1 formylglycine-generating enzyme family protein [Flavobacterium sp. DG2-3]
MKKYIFILTILFFSALSVMKAQEKGMAFIKEGSFVPLYGAVSKNHVTVKSFYIDIYPVTNSEFLEFVKKNPSYQKSKIKGIFADKSYLAYWSTDLDFGNAKPKSPVTGVSWFAAKKYCECQGKRLPTMDEWEYVAMADTKKIDARTKKEFNEYILSWYEKSKTYENEIGKTFKNYWGVYDMHGLVWEWTSDFNSIFLSGESRKDKSSDKNLFCGGASVNASDLMDYAAFMRYAFRGSLKAQYSTRNLGFRCASTTKPKI